MTYEGFPLVEGFQAGQKHVVRLKAWTAVSGLDGEEERPPWIMGQCGLRL
jgi:hypothetical protein